MGLALLLFSIFIMPVIVVKCVDLADDSSSGYLAYLAYVVFLLWFAMAIVGLMIISGDLIISW